MNSAKNTQGLDVEKKNLKNYEGDEVCTGSVLSPSERTLEMSISSYRNSRNSRRVVNKLNGKHFKLFTQLYAVHPHQTTEDFKRKTSSQQLKNTNHVNDGFLYDDDNDEKVIFYKPKRHIF